MINHISLRILDSLKASLSTHQILHKKGLLVISPNAGYRMLTTVDKIFKKLPGHWCVLHACICVLRPSLQQLLPPCAGVGLEQ